MSRADLSAGDKQDFQEGLVSANLSLLRGVPKTDLHNHCLLGIPIERIREVSGMDVLAFQFNRKAIHDINRWIKIHYSPVFQVPGIFSALVEESFRQAHRDGVTVLEMSIDVGFGDQYGISQGEVITTLQKAHVKTAPHITFRPCLGFSRVVPVRTLLKKAAYLFESGYFFSMDLYDNELFAPIGRFRVLFDTARLYGLRCTAHVGEFGTAEDVREAVEICQLDAVQHGIAASSSPDVMRWLADKDIPLNVCPTSNLILQRTESYKTHPIRILFDHGVRVTVNTDDVTLFGQGVSEEFLHLFQSGLFSADELETIRMNGFHAG